MKQTGELNWTVATPIPLPYGLHDLAAFIGGQSKDNVDDQITINLCGNGGKGAVPVFEPNTVYLCAAEGPQRLRLERLFLKLSLLLNLCTRVQPVHAFTKRGVGNINPSTVRAEFLPHSSCVPTFWNFRVQILGTDVEESFNSKWDLDIKSPIHDYYSIGMMLFTLLLTNKTHNMDAVIETVLDLLSGINQTFEQIPLTNNNQILDDVSQRLNQLIDRGPFCLSQIEYRPQSIQEKSTISLVWQRILLIGVKLMTRLPGFSYCDTAPHRDNPEAGISKLIDDLTVCCDNVKQAMLVEHRDIGLAPYLKKGASISLIKNINTLSVINSDLRKKQNRILRQIAEVLLPTVVDSEKLSIDRLSHLLSVLKVSAQNMNSRGMSLFNTIASLEEIVVGKDIATVNAIKSTFDEFINLIDSPTNDTVINYEDADEFTAQVYARTYKKVQKIKLLHQDGEFVRFWRSRYLLNFRDGNG